MDVEVDETHVYWPTFSKKIYRVSKNGGTPEPFVSTTEEPMDIAIDAKSVYWSDSTGTYRLAK